MKQLSTIILLVLIVAQTFSKCWLLVGFAVNQSTIAATLCENRKKVNSHCNGKCFLRKQMAKQEKEENSPLNNSSKEKFEVVLIQQPAYNAATQIQGSTTVLFPAYTSATLQQDAKGIFHPPRV